MPAIQPSTRGHTHVSPLARRAPFALIAVLCLLATCRLAFAQCEPRWLPGDHVAGVDGPVLASALWDPDGQGPGQSVIVLAGEFLVAGDRASGGLVGWDPVAFQWFDIPAMPGTGGPLSAVHALLPFPDGRLVIGGGFSGLGIPGASRIAMWNGQAWTALGMGFNNTVRALAAMPDGSIVAAGSFTMAGVASTSRIAMWNGAVWSPLGTGIDGPVYALAVDADGGIIAAGDFSEAGGVPADNIARWDGVAWSALGGADDLVRALAFDPAGMLIAAGDFRNIGGIAANRVAAWNGQSWAAFGSGLSNDAYCIATDSATGALYVGGRFSLPDGIARWDGSTWVGVGQGFNESVAIVQTLAPIPGGVLAGGVFRAAGGVPLRDVARWDGTQWLALHGGSNGMVRAVVHLPAGGAVVGGEFTVIAGVPANRVAYWNGVAWSAMGEGLSETVWTLKVRSNGELLAGADEVYRWNGQVWDQLTGPPSLVWALAEDGLGHVYSGDALTGTGTSGFLNRWNGSQWTSFTGGPTNPIEALWGLPSGGVLVGGNFTSPAVRIGRFDGSAWSSLGAGLNGSVRDIVTAASGDVYAGGTFSASGATNLQRIARWNGIAWSPLGSGLNGGVEAMHIMPDGNLVAGGSFSSALGPPSISADAVAVWNGTAWAALGEGLNRVVYDLDHLDGELLAAGQFTASGGLVSAYFARHTFTNSPWVALHPQPFTTTPSLPVTLSATPAVGYDNLTFQWQRETAPGSNQWANLTDGPGGASPSGGTVSNATGTINGGQPALCTITNLALSDAGNYRCIISNLCGQDESNPALLSITNPCPPDLTTTAIPGTPGYGQPNGTLNNDDFFFYLAAFASGNLAIADLTTTAIPASPGYGIPNGSITNDDFFYYLILFSTGC